MFDLIEAERKTTVLRHPTLPCLSAYHTLNLLSGCPFECRYCYTQSYSSHPGWGKLVFYVNTFDLLQRQLPRMRTRPTIVYLSTACEPFTPHEKVLDQMYRIMELLLASSIGLLISTKAPIPERFLALFQKHPGRVHVQVGLTTMDDTVRQVIEPRAFPPTVRLANLVALSQHGISHEVRVDPLIPGLTDTDENLRSLFAAIAACGTQTLVASYLFLRSANRGPMMQVRHGEFSFAATAPQRYTQQFDHYCGSHTIDVVDSAYRQTHYQRIKELAGDFGLSLGLCRCKNPDVTNDNCHAHMPMSPSAPEPTFEQLKMEF
jgi:DNA repair photolyase